VGLKTSKDQTEKGDELELQKGVVFAGELSLSVAVVSLSVSLCLQ
jgi:hypothetical protein